MEHKVFVMVILVVIVWSTITLVSYFCNTLTESSLVEKQNAILARTLQDTCIYYIRSREYLPCKILAMSYQKTHCSQGPCKECTLCKDVARFFLRIQGKLYILQDPCREPIFSQPRLNSKIRKFWKNGSATLSMHRKFFNMELYEP